MKNKYYKLKLTILLQAMFITSVTVLVGSLILVYFVDGVYNDSFANIFLRFMKLVRVDEESAVSMYWNWIGHNKLAFMIIGFLALFALFAYIGISSLTKYLDQIGDGIESILSDSDEPIKLITELKPLEERMNEIKTTIRRQEREAEETEQKKNDLVLFLAHDLKTPLTSVVAYLTMLEEHPDMTVEERARYTHISLEKAIAREIVELHGGTIRAESQNGKTRFIVVLPKKKGIEENEIYTHRRRTSWSMSERWKGLHRK